MYSVHLVKAERDDPINTAKSIFPMDILIFRERSWLKYNLC